MNARLAPAYTLALALALCCPAAASRGDSLPAFDKLVGNLGYEITPETADTNAYFAAGDYNVSYAFSNDKTVAILSISYAVTPAQSGKLPAKDMLKANSELTSSFQIKSNAAQVTNVALSRYFLVAGLTPVGLRQQVEALTGNATEYTALLNPENWK